MLVSPWLTTAADRYATLLAPGVLALAYTGLVLAFWTRAEGGFGSLAEVATLFETRELLLADGCTTSPSIFSSEPGRCGPRAPSPFRPARRALPRAHLPFGPAGLLAFLAPTAAFRAARLETA